MLHIKMIISNFGWFLPCKAVKGKPLLPVSLCFPSSLTQDPVLTLLWVGSGPCAILGKGKGVPWSSSWLRPATALKMLSVICFYSVNEMPQNPGTSPSVPWFSVWLGERYNGNSFYLQKRCWLLSFLCCRNHGLPGLCSILLTTKGKVRNAISQPLGHMYRWKKMETALVNYCRAGMGF